MLNTMECNALHVAFNPNMTTRPVSYNTEWHAYLNLPCSGYNLYSLTTNQLDKVHS